MPLRMIARDLYTLQKEVDALEEQLKNARIENREALKEQLRKKLAERDRMRRVLEGNKEPPSCRQPR